jgi:hypothetical protein
MITKIFQAQSGTQTYKPKVGRGQEFRFTIVGTPLADINLFIDDNYNDINSFILAKAYCSDWSGAVITVELKLDHPDDVFSKVNEDIKKDDGYILNY